MARSDPEPTPLTRKAAFLSRLVRHHGMPRDSAEAWLEWWERRAIHEFRSDPGFWENGYEHILQEHEAGHRPPAMADVTSDERDPRL